MLTCKQFLQELNEYLDDTVDRAIREKLEAHVTRCPNCFVIFDTTKKTLQVYKGMEPQVIPTEIEARLMNALEKKMAAKKAKCSPPL
ncbi:MAG: anti-sigma factor family protein [Bryobacteraceae bacterium]